MPCPDGSMPRALGALPRAKLMPKQLEPQVTAGGAVVLVDDGLVGPLW